MHVKSYRTDTVLGQHSTLLESIIAWRGGGGEGGGMGLMFPVRVDTSLQNKAESFVIYWAICLFVFKAIVSEKTWNDNVLCQITSEHFQK